MGVAEERAVKPNAVNRLTWDSRKTTLAISSVQGLVDSADLLTAAKLTGHLVFDPCCLRGDKPLAGLYWTETVIFF